MLYIAQGIVITKPAPAMSPRPDTRVLHVSVVVMGVSGCGKTTLGEALAWELGAPFVEGDAFHPSANVAKMASGRPLEDSDRAGWLEALARRLAIGRERGEPVVLACSALKRRYRDVLRSGDPALRLVFLHGQRELIAARLHTRAGHFMPPSLLESQFRDLEIPSADEDCLACDPAEPTGELVRRAVQWLGERGSTVKR
ncbi:thermoresistant gluconokinase [mine drainage metagenome]|uniref:gluconokinase n=1 Tax=mine drainage metagenome TaxID=410659 RepID=A0A1J5RIE6_9ZZZZ